MTSLFTYVMNSDAIPCVNLENICREQNKQTKTNNSKQNIAMDTLPAVKKALLQSSEFYVSEICSCPNT